MAYKTPTKMIRTGCGQRGDITVVYSDHDHSDQARFQNHIAMIFQDDVHLMDVVRPHTGYILIPTRWFTRQTDLRLNSEYFDKTSTAVTAAIGYVDALRILDRSEVRGSHRLMADIFRTSSESERNAIIRMGLGFVEDMCANERVEGILHRNLNNKDSIALANLKTNFDQLVYLVLLTVAEADPDLNKKVEAYKRDMAMAKA